jgi:hypothetical protein
MKKAKIYYEGKFILSIDFDIIKAENNGNYIYCNGESKCFVPNTYMIIEDDFLGTVTLKGSDLINEFILCQKGTSVGTGFGYITTNTLNFSSNNKSETVIDKDDSYNWSENDEAENGFKE